MMAVDAGNSMDEMYNDESSRLKLALECINITLQQKVFNNSNHDVGFGVFGDDDSINDSYNQNFLLLYPPSKPNIDLIRKIQEMSKARLDNNKAGGDIFAAIKTCIQEIMKHSKGKKFNRRIFLFTNGAGQTEYDESKIKDLATEIRKNEIKTNIIPINFMQGYVFA